MAMKPHSTFQKKVDVYYDYDYYCCCFILVPTLAFLLDSDRPFGTLKNVYMIVRQSACVGLFQCVFSNMFMAVTMPYGQPIIKVNNKSSSIRERERHYVNTLISPPKKKKKSQKMYREIFCLFV